MNRLFAIPRGPRLSAAVIALWACGYLCLNGRATYAGETTDIPHLLTQWREPIDLDKRYSDETALPPALHGSWQVLAESADQGESVTTFRQPRPILEVSSSGWKLVGAKADLPEKPFLRLMCDRTDPDADVWFVAREKNTNPLLAYVPREGDVMLVRELKIASAKEGAEVLVEHKRFLVAMPGLRSVPVNKPVPLPKAVAQVSKEQPAAKTRSVAVDAGAAGEEVIVGRWQWFVNGKEVPGPEFESGGRVKGRADASWVLTDPRERRYQFMWGKDFLDVMTLSADGTGLRGKNNVGDAIEGRRISAGPVNAGEPRTEKGLVADEARPPMVVNFDLRQHPPGGVTLDTSNARTHIEPFVPSTAYWAPEKLNSWARITYKIETAFPIAFVELQSFGVNAWNRNADKVFDEHAKAFLEASSDGKKWTLIFSTTPERGIQENRDWVDSVRGSRTIYLRARLFAKKQANREIHHVQFLRSEPERGLVPRVVLFEKQEDVAAFHVAEQAKEKQAQAALVAKEEERKRKEQEAKARVYVLGDGRRLSGVDIENHNKGVLRKVAADLVGMSGDMFTYTQAQAAVKPILDLVKTGNKPGLRDYMTRFANQSGVAKEAKRIMLYRPSQDCILILDDGRALYWREVWEEATASLIPGP